MSWPVDLLVPLNSPLQQPPPQPLLRPLGSLLSERRLASFSSSSLLASLIWTQADPQRSPLLYLARRFGFELTLSRFSGSRRKGGRLTRMPWKARSRSPSPHLEQGCP